MDAISFTSMADGTAEEYAFLDRKLAGYLDEMQSKLPLSMMMLLGEQRGNSLGYRVDRYTHSLQTATRAFRDGADEETVATALLHDVGDGMGVFNHSQVAAALLRPFVSERNYWVARHHGLFQGYFYFHYVGRDRNERDHYRGHPHYQACIDFCDRWDGPSFDPDYDTMPLEAFEPILYRVFAKKPKMFD